MNEKLSFYDNEIEIFIKSRFDNVILARSILISFLSNLDLSVNVINELKTALSEAVTNAIVHGYDSDENKKVRILFAYTDAIIKMEVEDDGRGIEDIEKAKEPLYSSKLDEERAGLGFTIMEVFTDELNIESTIGVGTKITMTKRIFDEFSND